MLFICLINLWSLKKHNLLGGFQVLYYYSNKKLDDAQYFSLKSVVVAPPEEQC